MFAIPTLSDLAQRMRQAFRVELPGSDAWLWPNNIYASAKAFAGGLFELFLRLDYVQRQKFALTADSDSLDRHGEELGLGRRPAAPASGSIDLTCSAATSVAAGGLFARADGVQYAAVDGGALASAGTLSIAVQSVNDGKATLAQPATPLSVVSGVTTTGAVTAVVGADGLGEGADLESDDDFRARILFRKRNPPHGGSAADYVMWATEMPGVTRVYVERLWAGPGTVRVFPLMDDLYANGLPPPAQIAAIAAHIETQRPAGALVTVAAPTPVAVNITISGLTPDTSDVRVAVAAELAAMFRRQARVAGIDTPHSAMPYLATPGAFSRSWIWQAVANASGEQRHVITAPAADVALTPGQIAVLGSITFAP